MITLSATDLKILTVLQRDGGLSRRELAEEVGMSASTLWRRLNDLEALGVIRGTVVVLEPDEVGLPVCVFVFVNLANYEPDTRESFEGFVDQVPEVMECYSVTGGHDYTLIVRTGSVAAFERLLQEDILGHPSVATASSQFALRQHKYQTALPLGAIGA